MTYECIICETVPAGIRHIYSSSRVLSHGCYHIAVSSMWPYSWFHHAWPSLIRSERGSLEKTWCPSKTGASCHGHGCRILKWQRLICVNPYHWEQMNVDIDWRWPSKDLSEVQVFHPNKSDTHALHGFLFVKTHKFISLHSHWQL